MSRTFKVVYEEYQQAVETSLRLSVAPTGSTLAEACCYSLLAGGKRVRPVLSLAAADMLGVELERVLPWACAIECLHTASLIHDDLPALDDDDLRRGKPTCHKVFGDGVALLAGDELIAMAFELVAKMGANEGPSACNLLEILAKTLRSINLGQALDSRLVATQSDSVECIEEELSQVLNVYSLKTSALIECAVLGPACFLLDDEAGEVAGKLGEFSRHFGLVFQITDDLLSARSSDVESGKNLGPDRDENKLTAVALLGRKPAEDLCRFHIGRALDSISPFGGRAWFFRELCEETLNRRS